jgi:hypothetical protein
MALAIGTVAPGFLADDKANATVIPLPPQNGGAFGWGGVWLSFGADFGDVTLRTAVWNDVTKAWTVGQLKVPAAGGRINLGIKDGDSKVSVGRIKTGPTDTGTWPCSWLLEAVLKA